MKLLSRKIYLFIFLLLPSSAIVAQNNLPPVYKITTYTIILDTLLSKYWQMPEDKDDNLTFSIPQNIVDKIFQPFFTTKRTGKGTGLGLSLAYDIITKEHNGTIKVASKENEGSEFIIQLPI